MGDIFKGSILSSEDMLPNAFYIDDLLTLPVLTFIFIVTFFVL
jgi:hypothetical protein